MKSKSQKVLASFKENDFQVGFQKWQDRWDSFIASQGDYFDGDDVKRLLSCVLLYTVLAVSQAGYPADIRIVGSKTRGRVEVRYNNVWGTICSDFWDDSSARVVCRALGFGSGMALGGKETPSGSGKIWLDEVKCKGTETYIDECPHLPWGVNDCVHESDAGVECYSRFERKLVDEI
ncbi:macrophage receptor MARCO-like, partial [Octopus sinensis]|uniref:Macrophage receptor MARCO-like n=1 Tax=Octopus sinensis TaxID=2607531 RepID=A0A6P7TW03_9MOLL